MKRLKRRQGKKLLFAIALRTPKTLAFLHRTGLRVDRRVMIPLILLFRLTWVIPITVNMQCDLAPLESQQVFCFGSEYVMWLLVTQSQSTQALVLGGGVQDGIR